MDTLAGKKQMSSISMSLSDFYASRGHHYRTRLLLHFRNSKEDVLQAAAAGIIFLFDNVNNLSNTKI
ncbi:hypothetical protein M9H77_09354 [Catharanthus roseus]|uniref:Uncharacterized protein n=1 Tax=Catharanthus roseus TaxID=4058 RepID=A0ACC0C0Q7_CATRO|nr:hypothetical protein M9H77_09354 [Catharanthus roseus]